MIKKDFIVVVVVVLALYNLNRWN